MLAVDPWSSEAAVQKDSPELFQQVLPNKWDCELLTSAFITNLLPFSNNNFNYLRMTSEKGYDCYSNTKNIGSNEFGSVSYKGYIAVIHIDGNHDYDFVKKDCDLWLSKLTSGAWVIIDDYLWAHGDGPKRIGDEILLEMRNKIARAFTCGKALFIQFT